MTISNYASHVLPSMNLVPAPRALRKLATVFVWIFMLAPVVLILVPWQQNIEGQGRVVAFNPLERVQTIPAPVTGRLVALHVRDGQKVNKGDILAEMADQDPQYSSRLQQQYVFSSEKVDAARNQVKYYEVQLDNLEEARRLALDKAQSELDAAIEKIRAEERTLEEIEADLEQKRTDRERKWKLFQQGLVSELDHQKAEAAYLSGKAKVGKAKADVNRARHEEKAKQSDLGRIGKDLQAKIESTYSQREESSTKLKAAEKEQTEAQTKLERQKTQTIYAPRAGFILSIKAANSADFLYQGEPFIELIPDTDSLAVELWVVGNDAPLVTPGRKVRLQFEGWPAVQFAGWPSVAIGTFGGVVQAVDLQGNSEGLFRMMIVPDDEDEPWPESMFLRQGARVRGWVLLESVKLGFELWRQMNAFPPSIDFEPESEPKTKAPKAKKKEP